MKRKFLLIILALAIFISLPVVARADSSDLTIIGKEYSLPSGMNFVDTDTFGKAYDTRYITIILHAGENGYFDTPGVTEKESIQFRGEAFLDNTIPSNINENMIFVGWATTPDAVEPNVISGSTHSSMIGTDIYAIWTDKCYVDYNVFDGLVEIDGDMVSRGVKEYNKGDIFENLVPVSYSPNIFSFRGWYYYTARFGYVPVPDGMILDEPNFSVFTKWSFIDENIDDIEVGNTYHHIVTNDGVYYKFTPSETKVYELFFNLDSGDYGNSGYIEIKDVNNTGIRDSGSPDDDGNANLTYTMIAGETYYIQFRGSYGGQVEFDAGIREANYRTVTFHSNRDEQGDAYFDGDETKTTTMIPFSVGEEISHFQKTGIEFKDYDKIEFVGWALDPEESNIPLDKIIVTEDIDVYGIYYDLNSITLDANGGYYPLLDDDTELIYDYQIGTPFSPPYNPHIDDVTLKFAGWSKNPNATMPDEDILETITITDNLPKTLYAVYTTKILEVFDADSANGGYFLQDPSITTYESSKGLGHVFYGLTLYNDDTRMVPLGYRDQDDEFIPYTTNVYPFYRNKGDTTYKAVWGYKVVVDCNGGYLPLFNQEVMRLAMEVDGTFNIQYVFDNLGYPVMEDDDNKYVIGFATTPLATEPDIIDGVTPVKDLDRIYAVWSDDEYYFTEGDNSSWTLGSTEGLQFIIKRKGYDIDTFSAFTYVMVDGEIVSSENYKRKEGSLILTFNPDYLNTLSKGNHEIVFRFAGETDISTSFNINEVIITPTDDTINPSTGDNIMLYVLMFGLSIIGLIEIRRKKYN